MNGVNKHISSSQPILNETQSTISFISATQDYSVCICNRQFKTKRGLQQHQRNCNIFKTISRTLQPEVENETYVNSYESDILYAYELMVHWKKELFQIPKCSYGKEFMKETTKLINEWKSNSPTRNICLKAMMVMPSLLLMRTSKQSKTAENKKHLARRLQLWKDRNIKDLLLESITINSRKPSNAGTINEVDLSRRFSQLMMEGKINPALRLLEQGAFSVN